ncbi:hypothetical protein K2X92_04400 [Candidatus Gracilibacteria bacterium]|nr:hypothetical protein [Candidatus Gracilibacteria bacterium]
MSYIKSLSGMENTPEFNMVAHRTDNTWDLGKRFPTSLGHIVTKILDMNLIIELPNGKNIPIFTDHHEVNRVLGITMAQYHEKPNSDIMSDFPTRIYQQKVCTIIEKEVLSKYREFTDDFFRMNVLGMLEDDSSLDDLFREIHELQNMGIDDITDGFCDSLNDFILRRFFHFGLSNRSAIDSFRKLPERERQEFSLEKIDFEELIRRFSSFVVYRQWKKDSSNRYVQSSYILDLENHIQPLWLVYSYRGGYGCRHKPGVQDQFRNTRYL